MSDDGEVYASASVSMADLAKGRTGCRFSLPLQPVSTIRGGSCLDWKSRPGRYLEVRKAGAAPRPCCSLAVRMKQGSLPLLCIHQHHHLHAYLPGQRKKGEHV